MIFGDFLDRIADFFQGDSGHAHGSSNEAIGAVAHSGVDWSMYTVDELKAAFKSALDAEAHHHPAHHGCDISFGAAPDVDARNLAKSELIDKLNSYHIYTPSLSTDNLWGGLDLYSGKSVYHALNEARDQGRISDTVFKNLTALLKKACHTQ